MSNGWEYFQVKFRNGAEYYFEVKVYERPSYWGINDGRVSKCLIHNRLREDPKNPGYDQIVYTWDRGPWHPRTPPKRLIDEIMRRYPGTLPPYVPPPRPLQTSGDVSSSFVSAFLREEP